MGIQDFTFVTGNMSKVEAVNRFFGVQVPHQALELEEIQSVDLEEIIVHKARQAYRELGRPVLVEDTALYFEALGKLPGPFIKWFEREMKYDGLCRILDSFDNRKARAEIRFATCDANGDINIFGADLDGRVPDLPRGENGFGWDCVFIPNGYYKTQAEMSAEEKQEISMRTRALEKLQAFLKDQT